MLILSSALIDEMVAHAREQHPIEACGVIAGPSGSDRPTRLIRMRNALESPAAYQFDAAQQLALYRQMDARGEDPIVIYHSHTDSPPHPSGTDTRFALDRDACYAIVSTADPGQPQIRAWRLTGPRDGSWAGPVPVTAVWDEESVVVEDAARHWQWPSTSAYLASAHLRSGA